MNWIWVWLGIVVVALVLEFITMELVSIWFAFGGFVSLIMSACGASVASQWIVFGLLSLGCILGLRKVSLKLLQKDIDNKVTSKELAIGTETRLLEDIAVTKKGLIKVNGVEWSAISEKGEDIKAGALVKIVAQQGNKYVVKKIADAETEEEKTETKQNVKTKEDKKGVEE